VNIPCVGCKGNGGPYATIAIGELHVCYACLCAALQQLRLMYDRALTEWVDKNNLPKFSNAKKDAAK